MSFTDEQFDRAFAEFQEFGPVRSIPVERRWRDSLRDVDPCEHPALRARCEEIEAFALELAEKVRDGRMTDGAAIGKLAETYPYLTSERLSRTWSQAMYFSLK